MQTRILVADDNAEIREILRILLTGEVLANALMLDKKNVT